MSKYKNKALEDFKRSVRNAVNAYADNTNNDRAAQDAAVAQILVMFPNVTAHHVPDADPDVGFIGEQDKPAYAVVH